MNNYKRLTSQKWTDDIDLTKEYGYSYIYKRLYELEDKIENGTLKEIPKNAVVLTEQEQNKILKATEKRINELKQQIEQTRKETAKEIFRSFENAFSLYYPHGILTYEDFQTHFMHLAEKYGVEVEE